MKLAIMQPYFFPYIGYFQAINAVDKYILYDNLNYIKEGWVHRNRILINGKPSYIAAQLQHKSSNKKIAEIALVEDNRWKHKLLKTLFLSYKSAPFFEEIYSLIETIFDKDNLTLSKFNAFSIQKLAQYLDIKTEITTDCKPYLEVEKKLEPEILSKENFPEINLDTMVHKVVRVLEICKQEKATIFVNAIGGQELYYKEEFKNNGIELYFVQTLPHKYVQKGTTEFIPYLSVIDVLMNCGKQQTQQLLNKYQLV